jgi:hypothetical protein
MEQVGIVWVKVSKMKSLRTKQFKVDLATKYKVTLVQIDDILDSPFKLLRQCMIEGDRGIMNFKSVRIPNFGIFYCADHTKRKYLERNNEVIRLRTQKSGNTTTGINNSGVQEDLGKGQDKIEG